MPGEKLVQLGEGRRVEGAGDDARDPECREPRLHHARGFLGERHREDLAGRERPGRHLMGDPARDRRGLPRPGSGEDAHRPAHGLGGAALLGVQTVEDLDPGTLAAVPAGIYNSFVSIAQRHRGKPKPACGSRRCVSWGFGARLAV